MKIIAKNVLTLSRHVVCWLRNTKLQPTGRFPEVTEIRNTEMKPIFSGLAELQTVSTKPIDRRVSVRRREWMNGQQMETTNDVMVDGYVYTPAVSDSWIEQNIFAVCQRVGREIKAVHIGHGQFVNP
jgi:hypothetical protein